MEALRAATLALPHRRRALAHLEAARKACFDALQAAEERRRQKYAWVLRLRPDAAYGAAVAACHQLLEGSGGRLLVFQHSLPSLGPLRLVHRDQVESLRELPLVPDRW